MAKKATRKGPTKKCPSCGKEVHARTAVCPNEACQHRFVFANANKPQQKATGATADYLENQLLRFALKAGGIDAAREALEKLAQNEAMKIAIDAGGIEKAQRALESVATDLALDVQ